MAAATLPREYFVRKTPRPCYALTNNHVIYGMCHLREDATLEQFLQTYDIFIPLTQATIYLVSTPSAPWQRDLVVINRDELEVMYLTDQ